MTIQILTKKERKEILEKLEDQYGIEKIQGILILVGKERIFLYQGNMNGEEIRNLEQTICIERIGTYIAKIQEDKIRLSIEGSQILKDSITKNIFDLNEEQATEWMMGRELGISSGKIDYLIMRYKNDFLGTGKASQNKITNFIPKNRRLKEKS